MARTEKPRPGRLKPEDLAQAASRLAERSGWDDGLLKELARELEVEPDALRAYLDSLPKRKRTAPTLTRERIVAAAIRVADERGLEDLTLRRVATELAVTPMAIYRYVESKDALLDAMIDAVYGEVLVEEAHGATWQQTIRALLLAVRDAIAPHPAVAVLAVTRPVVLGESAARLRDIAIGAFRRAGLGPREAFELFDVSLTVAGPLMLREASLRTGSNYMAASREARLRRLQDEVASYPADRYPYLAEAIEFWTEPPDPGREFETGIDMLVSGLEAQVEALTRFGRNAVQA
jgi:AcrR family transcriptional regulator